MPDITSAAQLYRERLYPLRHGHGLWVPEPNIELPTDIREEQICIGDVGFLSDSGGFVRIFNVCESEDYALNRCNGVPPGFKPMPWNRRIDGTKNYLSPEIPLYSAGAKHWAVDVNASVTPPGLAFGGGGGFAVSFSKAKGALLLPSSGANHRTCLEKDRFLNYAKANGESWYRFVNGDLEYGVINGSLYLITESIFSSAWEVVVVDGSSNEASCSLEFNALGIASTRVKLAKSTFNPTTVTSRRSEDSNAKCNQTLFVRGICVSLQNPWSRHEVEVAVSAPNQNEMATGNKWISPRGTGKWVPFGGSSGVQTEPRSGSADHGNPHESETVHLTNEMTKQPNHPLMAVNEALLQRRRDAMIAVTCDNDWVAVLSEKDNSMPGAETLIDRMLATHDICVEDGAVFLKPRSEEQRKETASGAGTVRHIASDAVSTTNVGDFANTLVKTRVHGKDGQDANDIPTNLNAGHTLTKNTGDFPVTLHDSDLLTLGAKYVPQVASPGNSGGSTYETYNEGDGAITSNKSVLPQEYIDQTQSSTMEKIEKWNKTKARMASSEGSGATGSTQSNVPTREKEQERIRFGLSKKSSM